MTKIYSTHLLRHLRLTIGQNIHVTRTRQKMTLRYLSKKSGVPELRIDHYELGKNNLDFVHLVKIACTLEVDVKELLE